MTIRSAPPVALKVPAPRATSVRTDERRAGDRRVTQRTAAEAAVLPERRNGERRRDDRRFDSLRTSIAAEEEREAAVAIALARSADRDCFEAIYRRDLRVMLWLTLTATAVYSYDLLLLTGRLTLS